MIKGILKRIHILNGATEEMKIIYFYRYISLLTTSLFYLAGDMQSSIGRKLIVIGCLAIASIILNHLYVKNQTTINITKLLIVVEIIGNILILMPTGGLKSPYILYSLNTILVIMHYLNIKYCILNIFVYMAATCVIAFFHANKNYEDIIKTLWDNSNLILSYILIAALLQLLLSLINKLSKQSKSVEAINNQLTKSNGMIKNSMEHIMSLYQTMYSFTNFTSKRKLINFLTNYTRDITKVTSAFFYMLLEDGKWLKETSEKGFQGDEDNLTEYIKNEWENFKYTDGPIRINVNDKRYLIVIIKSTRSVYGLLGIEEEREQAESLRLERINQLEFMASLSAITFEKFEQEEINEHLLITEEQKRIANEIHDSTSQRLFAISCMIYKLIEKSSKVSGEQLNDELNMIRDSLGKTIKELREVIYDLSWKSKDKSAFHSEITKYINDISKMNNVDISFNIVGNQELVRCDLKKTIYRIICEGTGNAIRHGKCSKLQIDLNIGKEYVEIFLKDNGSGFNIQEKGINGDGGLGVKNMYNLVYLLNGEMNIESEIGKGTYISVLLPNKLAAVSELVQL